MFLKKSALVFLSFVMILLSGCSIRHFANAPVTYEKMTDHGLLVFRFTSNSTIFRDGDVYFSDFTRKRYMRAKIKNRRVMIQLEPGQYKIDSLEHYKKVGPRSYSSKVNLSIKFDIEAGQVANLGAILLYSNEKKGEQTYTFYPYVSDIIIHTANNANDVKYFLKYNNPHLYEGLGNKTLKLPSRKFLTKTQVNNLRYKMLKTIPEYLIKSKKEYQPFVFGTLYRLKYNSKGKIVKAELIPTGTYEDIEIYARRGKDRFACLVPGKTSRYDMIITSGNHTIRRKIPDIFDFCYLGLYGKKGVVAYDRYLRIATSNNNGRSWQLYLDSKLDKPVGLSGYVGFHEGKKGIYVYSRDTDHTILYRDKYSKDKFITVMPPATSSKIAWIKEVDKGLFLKHSTVFRSQAIYFRSNGSSDWGKKELPVIGLGRVYRDGNIAYINDIIYEHASKLYIKLRGDCWESKDLSTTWEPVYPNRCKAFGER